MLFHIHNHNSYLKVKADLSFKISHSCRSNKKTKEKIIKYPRVFSSSDRKNKTSKIIQIFVTLLYNHYFESF